LMLNKPGEILNEVAGFPSFEDGDLIMTGTPKGVGPIKSGDKFNGKIFEKEIGSRRLLGSKVRI